LLFSKLARAMRRTLGKERSEEQYDRQERDRLSAEYTGSFTRNPGQEYGKESEVASSRSSPSSRPKIELSST
jgi:hypothetical protein